MRRSVAAMLLSMGLAVMPGSAELPTNLAFSGANLHPIAEAVTPFTHNKQRGF
jgi:hypothetical protein